MTPTTPPEEPPARITPKEIGLFALFGLIPILLIYLFAAQVRHDPAGAAFEQERRLLLDVCLRQLDDREQCRALIDEPLIACYKTHALEDGTVSERAALQSCITRRDDGKFRPHAP